MRDWKKTTVMAISLFGIMAVAGLLLGMFMPGFFSQMTLGQALLIGLSVFLGTVLGIFGFARAQSLKADSIHNGAGGRMRGATFPWLIVGVVFLAMAAGIGLYMAFVGAPQAIAPIAPGTPPGAVATTCPPDTDSSVTLNWINGESEGAEIHDVTGYILGSDGKQIVAFTDTTAGTATINCGEPLTIKLVAATGNNGDNSKLDSVSCSGAICTIEDGAVKIFATKGNVFVNMVGSSHGVIEARMFSKTNNAYMYDSGDSSANDYETTGTTFTGTTNNATATAIGSGGQHQFVLEYRATQSNTSASDFAYYILLDADASDYAEPSCYLNSAKLTNAKGSFTAKEAQQFSAYEYAYRVNEKIIDDLKYLDCNVKALAGVDADADVVIGIAGIGNTLANDGLSIQRGATDDDASATVTHTLQSYTWDIS